MMKLNVRFLGSGIVIAVALALAPAHAASNPAPQEAKRAEKSVEKDAPRKDGARKPPASDTDSCRRDAQGMHGPDRANFMTECLRKRP